MISKCFFDSTFFTDQDMRATNPLQRVREPECIATLSPLWLVPCKHKILLAQEQLYFCQAGW